MDHSHEDLPFSIFRQLVDSCPASITIHDMSGTFLFANEHTSRMHGFSEKEFLSIGLRDLDTPLSARLIDERMQKLSEQGEAVFIVEHKRKDGTTFPLEVHAKAAELAGRKVILSVAHDITESKKLHDELRSIANHTFDWEIWFTPDGNIRYMSPSCERITGYSADDFKKDKNLLLSITSPKYRQAMSNHYLGISDQSRRVTEINFSITTKNGETRQITHVCHPIFDENRTFLGRRASNRDVTERWKQQTLLERQQRRLNEIIEATRVGTWEWNIHTGEVNFSKRCAEICGYTPEELTPADTKTWERLAHPEDSQKFDDVLERYFAGDAAYFNMDYRMVHKSGKEIWVNNRGAAVEWDEDGHPAMMFGTFTDITEGKNAETELRIREERYRQLLESTRDSVYVLDREWNHVLINDAACSFVRIPREKLENAKLTELFPGIETTDVFRVFDNVMKARQSERVVTQFEFPDGRKGWYDVTVDPVEDGILCISRDITLEKNAEELLKESEERFRGVFDKSPTGIAIVEIESQRFVKANPGLCEILGYTEAELTQMTVPDVTHPDDWKQEVQRVQERINGMTEDFFVEKRYVRKDGAIRHVIVTGDVLETSKGRLVAIANVMDITERKHSEERFKAFFSQISQFAYMVSSEGVILDVNRAVLERLGFTRSDLIGKPITTVYAEESIPKAQQLFERWQQTGTTQNEELFVRTKAGGKFIILLNESAVRDSDGKILHSITLQTDITERVRLQEEIQRSQKLESLGILAGGIAHDFNNLLGGIYGQIGMAAEIAKDKSVSGHLGAALATIDRARDLTRQLLTFAKGGEPVRKPCSLPAIIRDNVHFALSGSNVVCRFHIPGDLWLCSIDRNQIGQVINNIVINAQQAMPNGGEIEVYAKNIELSDNTQNGLEANKYVRVSITDNGAGIPSDVIGRIFDPFYTTKPGGHGLGLATCYSTIGRHGGHIDVESEPGKGSTFHVYLPASSESPSPAPAPSKNDFRGSGTIIIMDDEEIIRKTMGHVLQYLGYRVISSKDGAEAIQAFIAEREAGRHVSGMIFDLTIPGGIGGKEAITEIRKIDAHVPVIVSSGYADDPVIAKPREYGFSASISKPFSKAELEDILKQHVTGNDDALN